jgi:transposase-like protein
MKEKKTTCQKKSVGFDLKLKIIDEVSNGQISVNHASIKYQVGRNAIYYWLQKFATLEDQKGIEATLNQLKAQRRSLPPS